jgi:two-component system, cell cycle response regulator
MRILIAEDDTTTRTILVALLGKAGYDVQETVNGAQAFSELKKSGAPRLAVLDWVMPEMDGLEVLRALRDLPTDQPPYLIMLTAKEDKADIVTALDAGADDFLSKPFDARELMARVKVGHRLVKMQDALHESRKALVYQADHDSLTGLYNRRAILARLEDELARAARENSLLFIGVLDIDHFKAINDTYGHQTGDEVLCELARLIKGLLRKYDAVGRVGGEEFLIISPMSARNSDDAYTPSIFERIRATIEGGGILTRSGSLPVTVSIGAVSDYGIGAVDDLLAAADTALYRAKAEGRNRIVVVLGK